MSVLTQTVSKHAVPLLLTFIVLYMAANIAEEYIDNESTWYRPMKVIRDFMFSLVLAIIGLLCVCAAKSNDQTYALKTDLDEYALKKDLQGVHQGLQALEFLGKAKK